MRFSAKCSVWLLWRLIFAIEWHNRECCGLRPWPKCWRSNFFQVAILTIKCWKIQILHLSSHRQSGICHRMQSLRILYVMTVTYIFKSTNSKCEYLENVESWLKMLKYDFYRGWYLLSNGTIGNIVPHDLDLHFQGQTFFLCIEYKISQENLARIVQPAMRSCSCFMLPIATNSGNKLLLYFGQYSCKMRILVRIMKLYLTAYIFISPFLAVIATY